MTNLINWSLFIGTMTIMVWYLRRILRQSKIEREQHTANMHVAVEIGTEAIRENISLRRAIKSVDGQTTRHTIIKQ